MKALITGGSGFVGRYLAEHLQTMGAEVYGLDRQPAPGWPAPASHLYLGGLDDRTFLRAVLTEIAPTHIFHLAGLLAGAPGGEQALYEVNVLGTLGLFDSLRAVGQAPRVLLAGSSAVYGAGGDGPIEETRPLQPRSAYAASKAAQEMVALHYGSQFGLPVIRARTFNLVGPRQPAALVISEIARQIASAERGGPACLKLGNLTPQRDFTDVRDAVRAYARLAEAGLAGEVYNVCTGRAHSVRECAESLLALASVPMRLASDPSRARPADIECQIGSARRLYQLTGWQPVIPFARSLADVLEDWRQQTAQPEELLAC